MSQSQAPVTTQLGLFDASLAEENSLLTIHCQQLVQEVEFLTGRYDAMRDECLEHKAHIRTLEHEVKTLSAQLYRKVLYELKGLRQPGDPPSASAIKQGIARVHPDKWPGHEALAHECTVVLTALLEEVQA